MTWEKFIEETIRYYGPWPRETPAVEETVVDYVRTKSEGFLEELMPLLKASRTHKFGPPGMKELIDLAEHAAELAMLHRPKALPEPPPAPEDKAAIDEAMEKLKAKAGPAPPIAADYKTLVRPKPFDHLTGVRWDEKIKLKEEGDG